MTPNQHFPTLVREGLPQLVRRVRRQPRELLWRRLLIDSAWMNPAAPKHRMLIVDSLLALFEADDDAPQHQEFGRMFKTWRWVDAERVADSVAKYESSLPSLEAEFLSSIAEEVDNRRACLSRARAALDRIPSETNPGEDLAALQGSILVRQDADEFARRFPTILEAINTGPFAGKHLCSWLLFRRRRRGEATDTLLRSALEATPSQNRSHDGEVELAAFDGLAALKRRDLVAVGVALLRMHEFALGAWFPALAAADLGEATRRVEGAPARVALAHHARDAGVCHTTPGDPPMVAEGGATVGSSSPRCQRRRDPPRSGKGVVKFDHHTR